MSESSSSDGDSRLRDARLVRALVVAVLAAAVAARATRDGRRSAEPRWTSHSVRSIAENNQ